jgi:ornithine--oxo-acid transaminase
VPFDLAALLAAHQGESFELHPQFMNPQLVKVLTTLGFDRRYVRAEASYLIDDRGAAISSSSPGSGCSPSVAAIP